MICIQVSLTPQTSLSIIFCPSLLTHTDHKMTFLSKTHKFLWAHKRVQTFNKNQNSNFITNLSTHNNRTHTHKISSI